MSPDPQAEFATPAGPAEGETLQALLDFLRHGGPTEMDCRELLEVIARYVDLEATGAAPDEAMPGVGLHLEDCDHCHELYEVLQHLELQRPSLEQELEQVWEEVRALTAEPGPA